MKSKISVVIVAYNEESKLRTCLPTIVRWADEVVVVDLGSMDQTEKYVRSHNCRYVRHPYVPYVELVRNFAIDVCTHEWILILDPDEAVPRSLRLHLQKITKNNTAVAVNIPRKNIFWGKWIHHTNFWPDYQVRFFRKGSIHWQEKLHSYPIILSPCVTLPDREDLAIIHTGYTNIQGFVERQNRYSSIRAEELLKEGVSFSYVKVASLALREFIVRYVWHQGYLDGKRGVFLVGSLMFTHFLTGFKLWELRK